MTRRGRFRCRPIDAEVEAFPGIGYAESSFGPRRFAEPVPASSPGGCPAHRRGGRATRTC
ncbi:hypothetical protein ACRAKI_24160 [Saccharothrix isguenensis]